VLSLDQIPVGTTVKVTEISKDSKIRRRLMDMGIIPGLKISVKGKAPLGDPIEVLVRGYKLSLRKNEAVDIIVEQ